MIRMSRNRRYSRSPGTLWQAAWTLTVWRWRMQWRLLAVAGAGLACAVLLGTALPLFFSVITTSGLRGVLRAQSGNAQIVANASVQAFSTHEVTDASTLANGVLQHDLASYLAPGVQTTVITGNWYLNHGGFTLNFYGVPIQEAAPHLQLLQGRLPETTHVDTSVIEVMLTRSVASDLDVSVGSVIPLSVLLATQQIQNNLGSPGGPQPYVNTLSAYVVGLFQTRPDDAYWNSYTLEAPPLDARETPPPFLALTDQGVLLKMLDTVAQQHTASDIFFTDKSLDSVQLSYHLDTAHFTGDMLPELIAHLGRLQQDANRTFLQASSAGGDNNLIGVALTGPVLPDINGPGILEKYQSQEEILQTPALLLTGEIVGLMLFCVSLVVSALVERERLSLAIMYSRGSSRLQLLISLVVQTLGLCLFAALVGPVLALGLVLLALPSLLGPPGREALNVFTLEPGQTVQALGLFTLVPCLLALLTLAVVSWLAIRVHMLAYRREEARPSSQPLWQRQRLDLMLAVLALAGYLLILYLQQVQTLLSAQGQLLVSTPLELLAPLLLVLAGILCFLRGFPWLLRLGTRLARRGRHLALALAVVQMERNPRRSMYLALLLGLTIAFLLFALVLSASQSQRAQDLADYQAVSDLNGYTSALPVTQPEDVPALLAQTSAAYRRLPGITSVTVGYVDNRYLTLQGGTTLAYSHKALLTAVDSNTFAQTALWSAQDTTSSLPELMTLLRANRARALAQGVVPALVVSSLWQMFGLKPGMTFHLADNLGQVDATVYMALAEVEHIPPTDDHVEGALLVDYQSLVAGRARYHEVTQPNYVWLRTGSDAQLQRQTLASLQNSSLALKGLVDRQALLQMNAIDPLVSGLQRLLSVGTAMALLLALLANILLPLLQLHGRRTSFAVLRALGASTGQLLSLLAWEMCLTLGAALLLGIGFGALLVATSVSPLVFSSNISGTLSDVSNLALYTFQQIIPVTIVVPPTVFLALAFLGLLSLLATGLMTWLVRRPLLAQALFIDDD